MMNTVLHEQCHNTRNTPKHHHVLTAFDLMMVGLNTLPPVPVVWHQLHILVHEKWLRLAFQWREVMRPFL
jgi:hypothetical protein